MAPPAKPSITGSMAADTVPKAKPIQTPTTSSRPMDSAMQNVRNTLTPATSSGAMMTIPSGMFCRLRPSVTPHEAASSSAPAMLTPAAMPSGNLCKAMAMTKSITRLRLVPEA